MRLVPTVILSLGLLAPQAVQAAEGYGNDGRKIHEDEKPEFVLEYDLERSFGRSPRWGHGPRLGLGIGTWDADGMENFGSAFDDSGDIFLVNVDWQAALRRPFDRFGFYASAGLSYANYTWANSVGSDLETSTIGGRLTGGYGIAWTRVLWEIGLHVEYGRTLTDDLTVAGATWTAEDDYAFVGGLHTSLLFSLNQGLGPEIGLFAQADHRRVRMIFNNPTLGRSLNLARGEALSGGAFFGWRF